MSSPEHRVRTGSRPHDDDLRIGVVGLGSRSELASLAHRPGHGSRIVAGADPSERRRRLARERFGSDFTVVAGHEELVAAGGLDAVMVLSPDGTHESVAVDFLTAGMAVYVEKPLAITVDGCDRMLRTAAEHGGRLFVGHNMRYMPAVHIMRDIIMKGEIGEVRAIWCRHFVGHGGEYYFKDWHADRSQSTGLLLQKGSHDLDVMHWLAGSYTSRAVALGGLTVYGDLGDRRDPGDQVALDWFDEDGTWPPTDLAGLNPVVDVEDLSMAMFELHNGVMTSYQQCHYTPDYWRNYTVIGTAGRLENFGMAGGEVRVWNRRRSNYRSDADIVVPIPGAAGGHGGADPAIVAEFLDHVRGSGQSAASAVDAREAVAAACAATASLRARGVPVDVRALDNDVMTYFASSTSSARPRRDGSDAG